MNVAAAKRQVFGQVGIDMIAGPSEVVVIADKNNDPAWIAADLLAQAEHDTAAQAILITDDAGFGRAVAAAVETELATLPRANVARASWENFGAIILVESLDRRRRLPIASRRSTSRSPPTTQKHWQAASATPVRFFSAATRLRSSAIMSPDRTMCCQPRAAPASPQASACSIS